MHHISAVLADTDTYKIVNRVEAPNSNGCYRTKVNKNGMLTTDQLLQSFENECD